MPNIGTVYEEPADNEIWRPPKDGKFEPFSVEPGSELPLRKAEAGCGAFEPLTAMQMIDKAVENCPDAAIWRYEVYDEPKSAPKHASQMKWKDITVREAHDQIKSAARALISLGLRRFQSVNIIGFNTPQWMIANLGAIYAGGMAAGIYPTSNSQACQYQTEHSDCVVLVTENAAQTKKFLPFLDKLPVLEAIVQYSEEPTEEQRQGLRKVKLLSWSQFLAMGAKDDPRHDALEGELQRRMAEQKPEHCSTLIYTSGTTGPPKAVMMTHDNISWTARVLVTKLFPEANDFQKYPAERHVSYLPLSHIAAQLLDIHIPFAVSAFLGKPFTLWFCRPDAMKGSLKLTLEACRPTVLFGVPRVWEKFADALKDVMHSQPLPLQLLTKFALNRGKKAYYNSQVGGKSGDAVFSGCRTYPWGWSIADAVIHKIKGRMGLDRARFFISGAAPMPRETGEFLGALQIPVHEAYGLSESTGVELVGRTAYFRVGAAGCVFPGAELFVDHKEGRDQEGEGELLFRGRHVMKGYLKDDKKTAETIDEKGYLHSGDIGAPVEGVPGLYRITGRIKELIIGAGGENIAPAPIEDKFKEVCPALSNVMMIGDRRKYSVALVSLKCKLDSDGLPTEELVGEALRVSSASKTVSQARDDPAWKTYLDAGLEKTNAHAVSQAAKIQKYAIIDTDFSIKDGTLTDTMKLKRKPAEEKYEDLISELYGGEGKVASKGSPNAKGGKGSPAAAAAGAGAKANNSSSSR